MNLNKMDMDTLMDVLKSDDPERVMITHILDTIVDATVILTIAVYGIPSLKAQADAVIRDSVLSFLDTKPTRTGYFIRDATRAMIDAGEKFGKEHDRFK